MTVDVKICGCTTPEAVAAAREAGAMFVGFIFYPPSPRAVAPERARGLMAEAGAIAPLSVAVVVDADDETLASIVDALAPSLLQLHGAETPERVADVRARFGLPVMKAVSIGGEADLARADGYGEVADRLLFDAKPQPGGLPGGNARSFDWKLLGGRSWAKPWLLSGGLNAETVGEAIATAHPPGVDVSSGVESEPGVKDPAKIREFCAAVRDNVV